MRSDWFSDALGKQFVHAFAGLREAWIEKAKALEAGIGTVFAPISEQIKDIGNQLGRALANFPDYAQFKDSAERLADRGWTLPMKMDIFALLRIADSANSDEDIDNLFVEYYTADENSELKSVFRDLLKSSDLERWRVLIEQCIDAFNRKHYAVAIPSLFSILEGIPCKNTYLAYSAELLLLL